MSWQLKIYSIEIVAVALIKFSCHKHVPHVLNKNLLQRSFIRRLEEHLKVKFNFVKSFAFNAVNLLQMIQMREIIG